MSRLFVLGNAGLDIGLTLQALPRPGETLLGQAGGRAPGGKGLNQAVVAARAGLCPVLFRAPIGNDTEGAAVSRTIAAEPFDTLELPVLPAATDLSVLMVLPDGDNAIVSTAGCAHALSPEDAAAFAALCQPGDWLLLQGNLRPDATEAAATAARARGARVLLNTAPVFPDMAALARRCDVVVANAAEAELLPADVAPVTVVTLGAGGCRVTAHGAATHHAAPPATAIDTTGAGDTFCGVLAACLVAGRPLAPAIAAAQRAAALAVTRPGAYAALPSAAELHALLA